MTLRNLCGGLIPLALVLVAGPALAQRTPAYQDGTLSPGDALKAVTQGRYGKAGGLSGDANGRGMNPFSVTDTSALALCANSAPTGGEYNALCLGHDSDGNGLVTLDSYGGMASTALRFRINGTTYDFPGTGNGNVLGPSTTAVGNAAAWNNTAGSLLRDMGAPPALHVPNNTALKALAGTAGMMVIRDGGLTAGDGGAAYYAWSTANCPAADDGAQVQPGVTGCWVADFSVARPTPKVWLAAGDGVTDDTAEMQAAMNARAGKILYLGPYHYFITGALSTAEPLSIQGDGGMTTVYATNCANAQSALIANSNINLLTFTGLAASLRDVCIQMATGAGTRTGGYAVKMGATASTQMGAGDITRVNIINAYDGMLLGGATTGATQTNGLTVADNQIISPSHEGIAIGRESTGASTPGLTLRNNKVACFAANATAVGIRLYDGAIAYDGTDNGPYGCDVGFSILPGTIGGNGQTATGAFAGVLGDSSKTADFDIDTATADGIVFYIRAVNAWAASVTDTDTPIRINNTASGSIKDIKIANSAIHSGPNQTTPLIDIQAGIGVTITGNTISADGGGMVTGPAIRVGSVPRKVSITNNQAVEPWGDFAVGLELPSAGAGAGIWVVTGNNFDATVPISYTPTGETAIIENNMSNDNTCPSVASASSVALPIPECAVLTGTTTVNTLTGAWSNRTLSVFVQDGLTLKAQAGGLCGVVDQAVAAGHAVHLRWYAGWGCWMAL